MLKLVEHDIVSQTRTCWRPANGLGWNGFNRLVLKWVHFGWAGNELIHLAGWCGFNKKLGWMRLGFGSFFWVHFGWVWMAWTHELMLDFQNIIVITNWVESLSVCNTYCIDVGLTCLSLNTNFTKNLKCEQELYFNCPAFDVGPTYIFCCASRHRLASWQFESYLTNFSQLW